MSTFVPVIIKNPRPSNYRTIADMLPGTVGYTLPSAYDRDMNMLDSDCLVLDAVSGKFTMKITREWNGTFEIEFTNWEY